MLLLRHGQSEFNRLYEETGRDPGIEDAPLTALGRAQAEAAAEGLAGAGIRRVLCSPYTRALQTATPVARRLGLPIIVTSAVRERYAASCDVGSRRTELAAAWPELDFGAVEEVWWPDEEELHDACDARAAGFRAEVEAHPDWAHTLVVCHWGFIMALTGRSLMNGEWTRCEVLADGRTD